MATAEAPVKRPDYWPIAPEPIAEISSQMPSGTTIVPSDRSRCPNCIVVRLSVISPDIVIFSP